MIPYLEVFALVNKVALVTGAGRGLGFEIAKAMAGAGAHVILNGRQRSSLEIAAKSIADYGGKVSIAPFDIAKGEARSEAFGRIVREHGRLDILVNNVGQRSRKPLVEFSDQEIQDFFETNLVAAYAMARDAAKLMVPNRSGRFITITSIAGHVARANDPIYAGAKHGLTGMVRALAAEYGAFGITSNAIAPGGFATEANNAMLRDPKTAEHFSTRTLLGRWGEPNEIGGSAVFLASSAASYITGHVLVVDGGLTRSM